MPDVNTTEFFRALYWSHDGRDIRLTTFEERDFPEPALTMRAFERANMMKLQPLYPKVRFGQFLRHGNDNEPGIAFAFTPTNEIVQTPWMA